MKKTKKVQINLFLHEVGEEELAELEAAELPVDEGATDLAEEVTGEEGISDGTAEAVAESSGNEIKVTIPEVPQVDGMQVNDELDLITTYRVKAIDGDEVTLEPIDYLPTEDVSIEEPGLEESLGAAPPAPAPEGGVPGAGAGGLGDLL